MTEQQFLFYNAVSKEIENKDVFVSYTPSVFYGIEFLKIKVTDRKTDKQVEVFGIVPDVSGDPVKAAKIVKKRVNKLFGQKIV